MSLSRRFNFFYASLVIAFFGLAACGEHKSGSVLARFDGATITDTEFNQKLQTLPRALRSVALRNKEDFVNDMANEHFLLKEAERRGIEYESDVRDLLKVARKKIIIAKLIETEVDKKIKLEPNAAQEYYEAHKEEFMTPPLLRASHILVKTEEEARAILNGLKAGADFEEMARTKSIDTTASRGGDMGFFQKGQLVPEFEEVAFQMKKGQISDIFQTQFGYHIMKLTDRMEPRLRDFASVKAFVEERILNQKRSKAFKAFITRLKGNTKIDINQKALEALGAASAAKGS